MSFLVRNGAVEIGIDNSGLPYLGANITYRLWEVWAHRH